MGLLSKPKAAAKAKAKDTAGRAGNKLVHGRNHCRKSPTNMHQYGREVFKMKDEDGEKVKITMLVCRHCSQPHPKQKHW